MYMEKKAEDLVALSLSPPTENGGKGLGNNWTLAWIHSCIPGTNLWLNIRIHLTIVLESGYSLQKFGLHPFGGQQIIYYVFYGETAVYGPGKHTERMHSRNADYA